MGVDYHAWTHRPKAQGGTDPIVFQLPWAYGVRTASQVIDNAAEELVFTGILETNAPGTFTFPGDDSGILVHELGFYLVASMAEVSVGDSATARALYNQANPLSSYPLFGVEFGFGSLSEPFALDTSLNDTTQLRMNHIAFGRMFPTTTDPHKVVAVAVRPAADYSVVEAGLLVVKIGSLPA